MSRHNGLSLIRRPVPRRGRSAVMMAGGLLIASLGISGCGIGHAISAVKKVSHTVEGNKDAVDDFSAALKSGAAKPFEATYVTTGTSPATVTYAVRPPHELSFTDTQTGTGTTSLRLVVNKSGEYGCYPPAAASTGSAPPRWTCQKVKAARAAVRNQVFGIYTPAHWVGFLRGFALAAGLAGDKVGASSKTVHGFSMHCLDLKTPGVTGTSKICTTAQGILGYIRVAAGGTSFELTSYSSSPPAALFELPAGARIATAQPGAAG